MSLLYPLYLLGALAVGLPIAAHLLRRSPRGLQPFGSTMFLRPSPPRVTKRSRLEHWPLLLLRAIAVCLLAFAFARPFLMSASTASQAAREGRRIALVVDTSASMGRDGLWDAATKEIAAVLGDVKPGDEVALFAFDHRVRRLLDFEEWNELDPPARTQVARGRLADLEPGWGGSDLGAALVAAVESLTSRPEDGRRLVPSVVVVGDVQEGSRLDRLGDAHWPEHVALELRRVESPKTTNAGLAVVVDRDRNRAPGETAVRVRVSNASDSTGERFRLQWAVDPADEIGAIDDEPNADDAKPAVKSVEVAVAPGAARTVLAPPRPAGLASGVLELVGDDHDFDNRVAVPETEPETVRLLYLGTDAENDRESPRYFLERAFPPTADRRVELLVQDPGEPPNPALLGDARFAVATEGLPEKHAEALRAFVERGGHLFVAPRSVEAAEGLAELLGAPELAVTEAEVDDYAMIATIDFSHPLFVPFSEARFSDFSGIRVWRHRLFENLPDSARVLARFEDGSPMFVEVPLGEGLVWLWGTGWHPADGQLALSTKFVPLVNAMLDASRGRRLAVGRVVVGDAIPLPESDDLRIARTPDGTRVELAADAETFEATDEPGVYEIAVGDETRPIAVALDPDESRTAPLPVERLDALGVRFAASAAEQSIAATRERQRLRRELENEQKTWRYVLLAVLVVVVAETLLGGHVARRSQRELEVLE